MERKRELARQSGAWEEMTITDKHPRHRPRRAHLQTGVGRVRGWMLRPLAAAVVATFSLSLCANAHANSEVAAGGDHSCAVLPSGHINCWGDNEDGELGNGTTSNSDTPVEVQGISTATQATAGGSDSCALLASGHIDCWGANASGGLGDGTTNNSDTPVEVQGIVTATQVTAGVGYACALLSSEHVDCWGADYYGELGNGTTSSSDLPVEVLGISTATQVTTGGGHTCALLSSGHVDCWGSNEYGQLGLRTLKSSDTPVEAQGIATATQVTAGGGLFEGSHTCALLSSGHIDCWGDNNYGELGVGTTVGGSSTPVEVQGISTATEVTAGGGYAEEGGSTCALLSSGDVDCWGDNENGELGNSTTDNSNAPVGVQGISAATQITAGAVGMCALLSSGHIDCWGENEYGQLGNGTTGRSSAPTEVQGISTATQITAGTAAMCALLSSNHIDCWGDNYFGELGDGTTINSDTPVEVQGIATATQITLAGEDHTCALLLSGHIDCWGDNHYGELGDGTTNSSLTPVGVKGVTTATQVTAGGVHTCALLSSGHIDCWGGNENGELGNGTATNSDTPAEVPGITTATQVSARWADTCALLSSGHIDCWGENNSGQLGDGTTGSSSDTPVEVESITTATQVSSGGVHTCALLASGHIDCWGDNHSGELGNGTTNNTDTPVEVQGISTATQITAEGEPTCARLSSGHIDCWGDSPTNRSETPVEVQGISTATQVSAGEVDTCALLSSGQVDCWGDSAYGALGNGMAWSTVPTEVLGLNLGASPVVLAGSASAVGQTTATVHATVNPNGVEVTGCVFEYGPTGKYGLRTPCSPAPGSGTQPVAVTAILGGLSAGTTYHYRTSVTTTGGTRTGGDETFTTLPGTEQHEREAHEREQRESEQQAREAHEREAREREAREHEGQKLVLGERATARPSSGTVLVRPKGSTRFVRLTGSSVLSNGSEVEAGSGRVLITVATPAGQTQSAEAYGGRFVIRQERSGFTDFVLSLPLTGCTTTAHSKLAKVILAKHSKHHSSPTSRHLWVSEHGGMWGTTGRYISTVVEGTHWLTKDECTRSEVQVVEGTVHVDNLVTHTAKLLAAGQHYTATRRRS